jgi:hypothetical protein
VTSVARFRERSVQEAAQHLHRVRLTTRRRETTCGAVVDDLEGEEVRGVGEDDAQGTLHRRLLEDLAGELHVPDRVAELVEDGARVREGHEREPTGREA